MRTNGEFIGYFSILNNSLLNYSPISMAEYSAFVISSTKERAVFRHDLPAPSVGVFILFSG